MNCSSSRQVINTPHRDLPCFCCEGSLCVLYSARHSRLRRRRQSLRETVAQMVKVNPRDSLPVYQQIVRLIKHQIANGSLKPGDRLPSAKDMAVRLLVNANAVAKAYTTLAREGLITCRPGSGTYVADSPRVTDISTARGHLAPRLTQLVEAARQLGIDREQVLDLLDMTWRDTEKG